jgi:hypothetical protein
MYLQKAAYHYLFTQYRRALHMKKISIMLILLGLGWYGSQADKSLLSELSATTTGYAVAPKPKSAVTVKSGQQFKCDGRTHCSQMTSCEEATFFINHCPDTKMDGNHDGVPCERQWCN